MSHDSGDGNPPPSPPGAAPEPASGRSRIGGDASVRPAERLTVPAPPRVATGNEQETIAVEDLEELEAEPEPIALDAEGLAGIPPEPPDDVYTGTVMTVHGTVDAMMARAVPRSEPSVARRAPRTPASAADPSGREMPAARESLVDKGEIAKGGMGSIRSVFDRTVLRHVAMKVLDPDLAQARGASARFLEEARITGQLEHPNIVPVYEMGVGPGGAPSYFTMKLVQGRTFSALLHARDLTAKSTRELERLLQIFLKVCDAVAFAHSRGVIHRDLKPANVMVGTHGQVYVMDWGLGMVTEPEAPAAGEKPRDTSRVALHEDSARGNADPPGTIAGTGAYMAPEQAWGRIHEIDARTDVFALGAMLYQVLTKTPPYCGSRSIESVTLAQAGNIPWPQERVERGVDLPPELCRIAMRAMELEPSRRYATVEALKAEVERALRGGLWLTTRVFAANEVIVREGEQGDAAYIITRGRCEAFKTENGQRIPLRVMGPGDVFGETAVFTSQPRTASVAAVTELTAMIVTRESLENELSGSPYISAFMRALAARFREVDARLSQVREQGRLDNRLHDYVHMLGVAVERGVVRARWSVLHPIVCGEFGITEADLRDAVARARDLALDAAGDTLTLTNPLVR